MENFDTKLEVTEKSLNNIRGIFDKEKITTRIKELEKITLQRKFLER